MSAFTRAQAAWLNAHAVILGPSGATVRVLPDLLGAHLGGAPIRRLSGGLLRA